MTDVLLAWLVIASVMVLAILSWGWRSGRGALGALLDVNGRHSLSRFQVIVWTILVLSLFASILGARLYDYENVAQPLHIVIPPQLLAVMGISIGSAATAHAVKVGKRIRGVEIIGEGGPAKLSQLVLSEEGPDPPTLDLGKWQNLCITLIAVIAYLTVAIRYVASATGIAELNSLPGFDGSLATLIGISHAGYIAVKVPDQNWLTMARRGGKDLAVERKRR